MTTSEKGHIMTRLVKLRETLGNMVANIVIYYYFQNILIHETLMGDNTQKQSSWLLS